GEETAWAAAGNDVARQQLTLPGGRRRPRRGRTRPADVEDGLFPGLVLDGPRLQLWRAPTDNDGLPLVEQRAAGPLERWRELGLDRLELELVSVAPSELVHEVRGVATHRHRYRETASGEILVENIIELAPGVRDVPRIGI